MSPFIADAWVLKTLKLRSVSVAFFINWENLMTWKIPS